MSSDGIVLTPEQRSLEWFARERLVLSALLVTMTFVLGPVPPPSVLPFSVPLYWTLLALLILSWLGHRPVVRPLGVFGAAVIGLAVWMALASVRSHPASVQQFLVWESAWLLALYAAQRYEIAFDFAYLRRLFGGIVLLQVVACLLQLALYENGSPTRFPVVLSSLFGDQADFGGMVDVRWRFVTGAPGALGRLTIAPGTFFSVNVLGTWMALSIPLLLAVPSLRRRRDWLSLALAATAILVVLRNLNRVSAAGTILGAAVFFVLMRDRMPRPSRTVGRRLLAAGLASALLVLAAFATVDNFSAVARGRTVDLLGEDLGLRLRLIEAGARALGERPVLGWGHGNYNQAMPRTVELARGLSERKERHFNVRPGTQLSAHNIYLIIAHDGGVPALAFFLTMVGAAMPSLRDRRGRWRREQAALLSGVIAVLFMGVFYASIYRRTWQVLVFMIGCLQVASARRGRPSEIDPRESS